MRQPGRACDELSVGEGFSHFDGDIGTAGEFDFRRTGGVAIYPLTRDHPGSCE